MENGKNTRYKSCAVFSAYPAADITTISSGWTSQTGMRHWRQRLPDVRSTAGRPTATDGYSYDLNSRGFTVTLKPYCGSCGSMACCLKFAAGKSTGLWNSSFTAQRPNQKWVTDISYIHTAQVSSTFPSSMTSLTTALSPTKPEPISPWASLQ